MFGLEEQQDGGKPEVLNTWDLDPRSRTPAARLPHAGSVPVGSTPAADVELAGSRSVTPPVAGRLAADVRHPVACRGRPLLAAVARAKPCPVKRKPEAETCQCQPVGAPHRQEQERRTSSRRDQERRRQK